MLLTSKYQETGSKLDISVSILLGFFAFLSAALLCLIIVFLFSESSPLISSSGWLQFFQDTGWYPVEGKYGMAPMIVGSIVVTLIAIVIALPVGLGCAIYLEYFARKLPKQMLRIVLNLLAGVPSVVFGLWGLTELVPIIASYKAPGTSVIAGSIVLALMVVPTVALTSLAALESINPSVISGAKALGLTRKTQILFVAIPAAQSGIIGGTLLATARAIGETMVVLMVAGNVVQMPADLFTPVRALTANIALEMAYALGDHRASLYASGLLLTLLVWLLAYIASSFQSRSRY